MGTKIRSALLAFGLIVSASAAAQELDLEAAKAFTDEVANEGFTVLNDLERSEAERLAAFQQVMQRALAIDFLSRIMLGSNRDSIDAAQRERFDATFPDYISRVYADQMSELSKEGLEVTSAKQIGKRDVVVDTVVQPEGSTQPLTVTWRLRPNEAAEPRVIDITVKGVSVMLLRRNEFDQRIRNEGIGPFLDWLESEAAKPLEI